MDKMSHQGPQPIPSPWHGAWPVGQFVWWNEVSISLAFSWMPRNDISVTGPSVLSSAKGTPNSSQVAIVVAVVSWVPQQARERRERQLVTVTVTQINDNSTTHVAATHKHEVYYKN